MSADALARVVRALDALEDGEQQLAAAILAGLLDDHQDVPACRQCGRHEWPGAHRCVTRQ
jgi:hypothetical protein